MNEHYRTPLFILTLAFSLCVTQALAQAMGKRPEQGKAKAVSRLTPEQERQAKAEFDSLMAIYDPWEAITEYDKQNTNITTKGTTKISVYNTLKKLDSTYRHSIIGDKILKQIIALNIEFKSQISTLDTAYYINYETTMVYLLRLVNEYPNSSSAENALVYTGYKYAGYLDDINSRYLQPYIELIIRYPKSAFVTSALSVVSAASEDFEMRMWAYKLWRTKHENDLPYLNITNDPKIELMYNDPSVKTKLKNETIKAQNNVGENILLYVSPLIGHAMVTYYDLENKYPVFKTSNPQKLYDFILPYCWESDLVSFKRENPFKKYKELELVDFYSDENNLSYTLKLYDVVLKESIKNQ